MNLKLKKVKYRSRQKHKLMTTHLKKPTNVNILTFHNPFGDQEVILSLTYESCMNGHNMQKYKSQIIYLYTTKEVGHFPQ